MAITFAKIIDRWPSQPLLASEMGATPGAVRAWKLKGIPVSKWPGLMANAEKWGIELTHKELREAHDATPKRSGKVAAGKTTPTEFD